MDGCFGFRKRIGSICQFIGTKSGREKNEKEREKRKRDSEIDKEQTENNNWKENIIKDGRERERNE